MIVFGTVVYDAEAHRRYAEPGIRAAAEAGSRTYAFSAVGPDARGLNLLLDAAAEHPDLEALVLVHSYAELNEPHLGRKVRAALADPEVAVAGCAGARGVTSLAWWEGDVYAGPVAHRYLEHGGGEVRAWAFADPKPAPAEVDALDGHVLVLSPWAVRNLRFDEELWRGHDLDFCLRARAAGRKVLVTDIAATLHRPLELFPDPQGWILAQLQFAERWGGEEADEAAWRARARRGEAEREAARIIAYFRATVLEARIDRLQARLDAATSTPGWRATEPLRRLNHLRRERQARR